MMLTTRKRRGSDRPFDQSEGIMNNQVPMFVPNLSSSGNSSGSFPPQASQGTYPLFGRPNSCNSASARHGFKKFRRNNFNKRNASSNSILVPEYDWTKPWVTEDKRIEVSKKQEVFELWKKNKTNASPCSNNSQNRKYFCENCDKAFRTQDDLFVHESEHETCGRDGCEFTAHPKIIAKHIKMQHESGLYKRIGKLYTEEDIAKWIEERKKRYPTRKLVEEKKILEQEKINRGERIKEPDSRFNKSFGNRGRLGGKKNFEKKTHKNKNQRKKKEKKVLMIEKCIEEQNEASRKGVPAFLGINTVGGQEKPEEKDFNISDEEWETANKPPETTKLLLNSSLGLLASVYCSDEEIQSEESPKETKGENISGDEGSGPEEVSSKNPVLENISDENISRNRKFSRKKDNRGKKVKSTVTESNIEKQSLTLLEKLLKDEIRHERNVILQCVHYVTKNNFFKTI